MKLLHCCLLLLGTLVVAQAQPQPQSKPPQARTSKKASAHLTATFLIGKGRSTL